MTDTQWLSEDEQQLWRSMLQLYRELFTKLDRQMRADAGIPATYYVIMAMLSEADGRQLRMAELAAITDLSQSRLSHAISALESRGWVERRACETDRRGQIAHLTSKGMKAVTKLAPGHVQAVRSLVFDHINETQVKQLAQAFRAINDGNEQQWGSHD